MDLIGWIRNRWRQYKEDKKMQEVYARLDRNAAGKFSKRQYIKDIKKVTKAEKTKK